MQMAVRTRRRRATASPPLPLGGQRREQLTFGPPVVLTTAPLRLRHRTRYSNTPGVREGDRQTVGSTAWMSTRTPMTLYPDCGIRAPQARSARRTMVRESTARMFASFVSYLPITCSSMSIGDPEEFAGRAEIAMRAVQSYAVEKQLVSGDGIATNPFLEDAAVTPPRRGCCCWTDARPLLFGGRNRGDRQAGNDPRHTIRRDSVV